MQPAARSTPQASSSVGTTPAEWHGVEEHESPGVVGDLGDGRGVGQPGGAVGDVVDHDQGRLLPHHAPDLLGGETRRGVDVDPAQRHPALLGDPHRDVAVGREVVAVDHDLGASGPGGDRSPHQLVEQHGGGVTDRDLSRRGPQADTAEVVAEGQRQVEPAFVPAADQADAPLALDERPQPVGGDRQRPAERVAVEIDQRGVGSHEARAIRGERIGVVQRVAHASSVAYPPRTLPKPPREMVRGYRSLPTLVRVPAWGRHGRLCRSAWEGSPCLVSDPREEPPLEWLW